MNQGLAFFLGNMPTVLLACIAAFLIHDGQSVWVWAWFLLLAGIIAISPKGDA